MPRIEITLYQEADGTVPLLSWLRSLPEKVQDKFLERFERLEEFGHELRRPLVDYLRDDIYEVRVSHKRIQYRVLYFFDGKKYIILTHGFMKERKVPELEIKKAIEYKMKYLRNREMYTFKPGI